MLAHMNCQNRPTLASGGHPHSSYKFIVQLHAIIPSVPKMRGGVLIMLPTALYLGFPVLYLKSHLQA